VEDGTFAAGSMGTEGQGSGEFVRRTGRSAAIGILGEAVALLEGRAGTRIVNEAIFTA